MWSFVRAVVQFDGEDDSRRLRIAENKVEVLLRNGAEGSALVASDRAGHHVGKADLAHDEKVPRDGDLEWTKERGLAAGK